MSRLLLLVILGILVMCHCVCARLGETFCFVYPVTSRGFENVADLRSHPSGTVFLNSVAPTLENGTFTYRMIVGFDYGDPVWDSAVSQAQFSTMVREAGMFDTVYVPLYGLQGRLSPIINTLGLEMQRLGLHLNGGCDYMMVANDDIHFHAGSRGWTTRMTNILKSNNNVGIVAFVDEWQAGPNFFIVHTATHLRLLGGSLCPVPFYGAHCDPCVFRMYELLGRASYDSQSILRNRVGIALGAARYDYGDSSGIDQVVARMVREARERM